VFLQNTGRNSVHVGGSGVTTVAGLRLAPGASVTLPQASGGIFAVSGFTPGVALGTASAAVAQGGSVITVASGGTAFTVGSYLAIEQGSVRQEVAKVAASGATSVTISTTFAFAHGSASTFGAVLAAATQVVVEGGAT
jgi:hypothetical protein